MKLFPIFFFLAIVTHGVYSQTTKKTTSTTAKKTILKSTQRTMSPSLKPSISNTATKPGITEKKTSVKPVTTKTTPIFVNLCRDRFATSINGTIRPIADNNGQWQCSFFIDAPPNKVILLTCSVCNLSSSGSELVVYGGSEVNVNPPIVNRIYTSRDNSIHLFSRVDNTDWFDCKWTMAPMPKTTEYKLCRDGASTSSKGTIQLLAEDTKDPRTCMFTINVSSDQRIQFVCSNVSLTSPGSYLQVQTMSDTLISNSPQENRVYTSNSSMIYLLSQFNNKDWFRCKWGTVLAPPPTSDFKLCRDKLASSFSGNIQPLMMGGNSVTNNQTKMCSFVIQAPAGHVTEISCPTINFTSPGSYLQLHGIQDLNMVRKPVTNRIYTSGVSVLHLNSLIQNDHDFFECKWSSIWVPSTTDFKLCRHGRTASSSGTIQPFIDQLKTGELRECNFIIVVPSDQKIRFSCSVINMTSSGNYLQLVGISDLDVNPPIENGIYFSKGNYIFLYSQFNNGDSFNCKWTSSSMPPTTILTTRAAGSSTSSKTAITTITSTKQTTSKNLTTATKGKTTTPYLTTATKGKTTTPYLTTATKGKTTTPYLTTPAQISTKQTISTTPPISPTTNASSTASSTVKATQQTTTSTSTKKMTTIVPSTTTLKTTTVPITSTGIPTTVKTTNTAEINTSLISSTLTTQTILSTRKAETTTSSFPTTTTDIPSIVETTSTAVITTSTIRSTTKAETTTSSLPTTTTGIPSTAETTSTAVITTSTIPSTTEAETTTLSLPTTTTGIPSTAETTSTAVITTSTIPSTTEAETTTSSLPITTTGIPSAVETSSTSEITTSTTPSTTEAAMTTSSTITSSPDFVICENYDPFADFRLLDSSEYCKGICADIGFIKSPNFPGDYESTLVDCYVLLRAPKGMGIELKFTNFNMYSNNDFLSVYDENGTFFLDNVTGSTNPGSISIPRSTLKFAFGKFSDRDHGSTIYNWQAAITPF